MTNVVTLAREDEQVDTEYFWSVTDTICHTHSLTDCPKELRTSAFKEETFLE